MFNGWGAFLDAINGLQAQYPNKRVGFDKTFAANSMNPNPPPGGIAGNPGWWMQGGADTMDTIPPSLRALLGR